MPRSPGELVELVEDAVLLGDREAVARLLEPGAALLGPDGPGGDPVELLADFAAAPGGPVVRRGLAVCLGTGGGTVLVARRDPARGWQVAAVVSRRADHPWRQFA